jgi:hypothetical protein
MSHLPFAFPPSNALIFHRKWRERSEVEAKLEALVRQALVQRLAFPLEDWIELPKDPWMGQ